MEKAEKSSDWWDGYQEAVGHAQNNPFLVNGKHVGFLAKASATSVGEFVPKLFKEFERLCEQGSKPQG